jgi:hypothetical protein
MTWLGPRKEAQLRRTTIAILLTLPLALWLAAGCSSEEARTLASTPKIGEAAPEDTSFSASITFCRKVSRKTGRPIGEGDSFVIRPRSHVNALVDFHNATPGRTHVVHLVWVRPDGKDIFRKYAEVRVQPAGGEGYQAITRWLDAVDLHAVGTDTVATDGQSFQLASRLNTSEKREREPGRYLMRVYLDRRLLLEEAFTLLPEVEPVS